MSDQRFVPPVCVVNGCWEPGRRYPEGFFCDHHAPSVAEDPAPEFKPCPFCGEIAVLGGLPGRLWVGCQSCDIGTPENYGLTQTKPDALRLAADRWNRRAAQ